MNAPQDPLYLRLYHEYANAARAYDNATKNRERARASLRASRQSAAVHRRPVGAPLGWSSRQPLPALAAPASLGRGNESRLYLGPILGWIKLAADFPPKSEPEPSAEFNASSLYDEISLNLYWNAKTHYEKTKRAFFDYVRRQNIQLHRESAKLGLTQAAQSQLSGLDDLAEESLELARRNIESACQRAWQVYQTSPEPKSYETKVLLLESLADAQLLGVDDRPIGQTMAGEVSRLMSSGAVTRT